MSEFNIEILAWEKMQGLLPVIVQHAKTSAVLMLGYMNKEALETTLATNYLTFYSRSKKRLWQKGETSGNKLKLIKIIPDCDQDTLLIIAEPLGPVCHQGTATCFGASPETDWQFIRDLEILIQERELLKPKDSYTTQLFDSGIDKIAQKVGEEAVEVVIAAIKQSDQAVCNEAADLLFHLLVLLRARKMEIADVINVLKTRFK